MTTIRETIQRLRELYEKACPGEWKADGHRMLLHSPELTDDEFWEQLSKDYAFIAEAHNAMPALLEYIEKLERVADASRARFDRWTTVTYDDLKSALDDLDKP